MTDMVEVKMGGMEISSGEVGEMKTFVGSCVALCLFDPVSKIAAMAHIMLPKKAGEKSVCEPSECGKYADKAFEIMLQKMTALGANKDRILAKIVGGAAIFSHESENGIFNIGARNIAAIKQILEEHHIVIASEDIGENFGRWVKFNLVSGEITVTSALKKTETTI